MPLTHIDENGNSIMVDVGGKAPTDREATAKGRIKMSRACFSVVSGGRTKKGDVLAVAQLAGIMATKKTADLIPLCHTIPITNAELGFSLLPDSDEIEVSCSVKTHGRTGVEMEALTGATVALLTIYDMCKAIDKTMVIGGIGLVKKTGGKSGDFYAPNKGDSPAPTGVDSPVPATGDSPAPDNGAPPAPTGSEGDW